MPDDQMRREETDLVVPQRAVNAFQADGAASRQISVNDAGTIRPSIRVREAEIGVPYRITTMAPSTQRPMTTASPASYDVRPMTAVVVALAVIGVVLLEHLGRG